MAGFDFYDVTGGMSPAEIGGAISSSLNVKGVSEFIPFGDSITAGMNSMPVVFSILRNDLMLVSNAGVGGDTTQKMIDRLDADIPVGPGVVSIMEAANDQGQSVPLQTHAENIKTILRAVRAKGRTPIMFAAPPKDGSGQSQYITEANIYDWVTCLNERVEMYDPWSSLRSAENEWAAGASSDGTHPNGESVSVSAQEMARLYKTDEYFLPLAAKNSFGQIQNGLFIDNTGTSATGFLIVGFDTISFSETALGAGNTLSFTADNFSYLQKSGLSVASGKKYLLAMRLNCTENSGNAKFSVYFQYGGGSRKYAVQDFTGNIADSTILLPFEASETTTDGRLYVTMNDNGGGFSGTIKIAQPTFFCIDDYTV